MLIENKKMRTGSTMIELIFVIVIIGILAGVAIPKISANRDDAIASVCTSALSTFLKEIATKKAAISYTAFKDTVVSDITNIKILAEGTTNTIAAKYDFTLRYNTTEKKIHTTVGTPTITTAGATFLCEGSPIIWIYTQKENKEFPIVIRNIYGVVASSPVDSHTPASDKAEEAIFNQYPFDDTNITKLY